MLARNRPHYQQGESNQVKSQQERESQRRKERHAASVERWQKKKQAERACPPAAAHKKLLALKMIHIAQRDTCKKAVNAEMGRRLHPFSVGGRPNTGDHSPEKTHDYQQKRERRKIMQALPAV